jgi:2-polyprenyl-3-methyl-5-hydroxy-6-metoxy-1,4-benzoquinol methylase
MRAPDWNPYYIRRAPDPNHSFEEMYWETATDPDGVERKPLEERERRLEDIKEELSHINALSPGRILDVGCGLGYLLSGVDNKWEKHGIELSQFAAKHASAHGTVHVGDLRSAAYPDAYFDVVVLYHVVEHMLEPVEEAREIFRVLKAGGTLIVGTPDFDSACARRFGQRYRLLHDRTHVSLFTAESLNRLLWDQGFFVERTEFPFFETRHFTTENLMRLNNTEQTSPPFVGNIMTVYCKKPVRSEATEIFAIASRISHRVAIEQSDEIDAAKDMLEQFVRHGGQIWLAGDGAFEHASRLQAAGFKTRSCADPDRLPAGITQDDLLFVVAVETVPHGAIAAAKARGIRSIAVVGERCEAPNADVVIDIPSDEPRVVEFVQFSVTATLCLPLENPAAELPPGFSLRENAAE